MSGTYDKTSRSQTDAIHFEIELAHRPEKVWRAITDPVLIEKWLLPVVGFDLAPGATFRFAAPPQPGWDGVVGCEVLAVEEPKRLRYAWRVGDLDTVVTFTLTPTASGTHLDIVQSGFKPEQKQNFGGARYGWNMMSGKLVDVLAALT